MSDETAVGRIAAVLRQVLPVQWPHEMAARALLASGCVVGLPVEPSPILDKLYRQQGLDLDVALYAVAQRQAEGAAT
jgi:hypothetical protein